MSAPTRRRFFTLEYLTVAFMLGSTAQERLGISSSLEGLQAFLEWVQSLGVRRPGPNPRLSHRKKLTPSPAP